MQAVFSYIEQWRVCVFWTIRFKQGKTLIRPLLDPYYFTKKTLYDPVVFSRALMRKNDNSGSVIFVKIQ